MQGEVESALFARSQHTASGKIDILNVIANASTFLTFNV